MMKKILLIDDDKDDLFIFKEVEVTKELGAISFLTKPRDFPSAPILPPWTTPDALKQPDFVRSYHYK